MSTTINTYANHTTATFNDMAAGEIFSYNGFIFICTDGEFKTKHGIANAVCLNGGSFTHFDGNAVVKKLDVEINVKFI